MTATLESNPLNLTADVSGESHLALLDIARRTQSLAGLVWREQLQFSPPALQLVTELESCLVLERLTDEWPGTRLYGTQAWYRLYRCDDHSFPFLVQAGSVYGWINPQLPEDISFHLPTGECWLSSVAHEKNLPSRTRGTESARRR